MMRLFGGGLLGERVRFSGCFDGWRISSSCSRLEEHILSFVPNYYLLAESKGNSQHRTVRFASLSTRRAVGPSPYYQEEILSTSYSLRCMGFIADLLMLLQSFAIEMSCNSAVVESFGPENDSFHPLRHQPKAGSFASEMLGSRTMNNDVADSSRFSKRKND